ncbi:MAG: hypothetical protein RLZZ507_3991 [Cyanobacteriota bacterium]|jgi:hypothetical protein
MLLIPEMQPKNRKNLLLAILLASSAGQWYCMGINKVWSAPSQTISHQDNSASNLIYLTSVEATQEKTELPILYLETPKPIDKVPNKTNVTLAEATPKINLSQIILLEIPANIESLTDQIYREQTNSVQPTIETEDIPPSFSPSAAQLLNEPIIISDAENAKRFAQQSSEQEESPSQPNEEQELRLRVRPRPLEEIPPPTQEKPVEQFQPIGYLRGYVGYFHSSNIFAANENQINDGLIYSGLTLASAYFPLSPTTYLNASIDGSLIYYLDQSQFDYNQVSFNLGIYQQLSQEMYAELNFSNQQLFYANNGDFFAAGDRFLNENSVQLSLGRRDNLTDKLILDSLYEFSANFSDPETRSRLVNSLLFSLSYSLQKPLQVGVNYQFTLSDFTQRDREDQSHRLFAHLNYRTSDTSNIYLQGGVNLGGSTTPAIDFSGWYFSVNYGFEIGRF